VDLRSGPFCPFWLQDGKNPNLTLHFREHQGAGYVRMKDLWLGASTGSPVEDDATGAMKKWRG